jgi:hypothetical protein
MKEKKIISRQHPHNFGCRKLPKARFFFDEANDLAGNEICSKKICFNNHEVEVCVHRSSRKIPSKRVSLQAPTRRFTTKTVCSRDMGIIATSAPNRTQRIRPQNRPIIHPIFHRYHPARLYPPIVRPFTRSVLSTGPETQF